MTLTLRTAADAGIDEMIRITNDAFTGYVGGDIQFDNDRFLGFLAGEGIHLGLSRVAARDDGTGVGVGILARLGWTTRLVLMGVTRDAQETGVGRWLMAELIREARDRGEHALTLECIEQNPRGLRLYEGCGFQRDRRLCGYALTAEAADAQADPADLDEIDPYQVGKLLACHGPDDLPWQVAGPEIMRLSAPNRAYHLDGAYAVIVAGPERVYLRSLVTLPEKRGAGRAHRLLRALFALHPEKIWTMPAICPEEIGVGVLEPIGFTRTEISQFQMTLKL